MAIIGTLASGATWWPNLEGEEERRKFIGTPFEVEKRVEKTLEKRFLKTDPDTWPVKVVKVRTKEGEICHFVKIIKIGGIKFKVEDKAIKMNVEGKEKNMEGKEKNMTQVPGRWGKKYVEGKEKNLEGEEVKLPDYEPWEVREAKVEEEDKELRNIMYLRKRRLEKEADPEKSIKQAIQVTKPKKKMKKSKLDLRCQEGVTMQVLKLLGSSYKFKAKETEGTKQKV